MVQPTRQQWGLQSIEIMGIVPMKYRAKTILHKNNLARLRERFGALVWPAVSLRTIWGEASLMRRPVFHLAPESQASTDAWTIINRVQEAI
jgi:cellulose biosynthesis protein BcsQ